MVEKTYLAMDFGASTGRGILGQFDGRKLTMQEIHRFDNYYVSVQGKFYWDILRLYHEIENSIQKAEKNSNLFSVGVDTWGTDYGFLDSGGHLLGNVRCMRNADSTYVDLMKKKMPLEKIFNRTGIQAIFGNTLFQLYERKLLKDAAYKNASSMLMLPDMLAYLLTGERFSEYTMATTSMMYSQILRDWDKELLSILGIRDDLYERILMPGEEIFSILPDILDGIGVNKKVNYIPVATHDTASAVAAVPMRKHEAFCSSGTWSLLGVEVSGAVLTKDAYEAGFSNEGTADGGIRLLKNIMGMWILQQMMREWKRKYPMLSWNVVVNEAEKAKQFRSMIDVEQSEFYQPGHMIQKVQDFCRKTKQPIPESIGELARCVYESLAMCYRMSILALEKIVGYKIEALHIVGGGCQNRLMNQFTANALQRPVYAGPVECACAGNILMQAVAAKEIADISQARQVVDDSFEIIQYEAEDRNGWEQGYDKYLKILESLR